MFFYSTLTVLTHGYRIPNRQTHQLQFKPKNHEPFPYQSTYSPSSSPSSLPYPSPTPLITHQPKNTEVSTTNASHACATLISPNATANGSRIHHCFRLCLKGRLGLPRRVQRGRRVREMFDFSRGQEDHDRRDIVDWDGWGA